MELIDIAIYVGLVVVGVLFILVCAKIYKILCSKKREAKKHEEVKIEPDEVNTESIETIIEEIEPVKRKKRFAFKKIDIKRKAREARQYDIWSK